MNPDWSFFVCLCRLSSDVTSVSDCWNQPEWCRVTFTLTWKKTWKSDYCLMLLFVGWMNEILTFCCIIYKNNDCKLKEKNSFFIFGPFSSSSLCFLVQFDLILSTWFISVQMFLEIKMFFSLFPKSLRFTNYELK